MIYITLTSGSVSILGSVIVVSVGIYLPNFAKCML